MSTATLLRRTSGHETQDGFTWSALFAALSARLGEIYSRKGSKEPKRLSWLYFSA
ncbi:hypothetical protein [Hyphomicrobium sp. CS1GBMeth3]|uniref:hypothetical protein n=1 Tax=Hyphomicrobium sp. CS1GBMeth3 TaxID=1892845 RepID=UPI000B0231FC|nr:hypothetical protein [Hyphomicrobium sp. CS1GBMeth3]